MILKAVSEKLDCCDFCFENTVLLIGFFFVTCVSLFLCLVYQALNSWEGPAGQSGAWEMKMHAAVIERCFKDITEDQISLNIEHQISMSGPPDDNERLRGKINIFN